MGAGHLKSGRSRMRGNSLSYEIFKGGELRELSPFLRQVSGPLSVFVLTFSRSGRLFSHWFIFLSQLICDHDRLGCCSDIVLRS